MPPKPAGKPPAPKRGPPPKAVAQIPPPTKHAPHLMVSEDPRRRSSVLKRGPKPPPPPGRPPPHVVRAMEAAKHKVGNPVVNEQRTRRIPPPPRRFSLPSNDMLMAAVQSCGPSSPDQVQFPTIDRPCPTLSSRSMGTKNTPRKPPLITKGELLRKPLHGEVRRRRASLPPALEGGFPAVRSQQKNEEVEILRKRVEMLEMELGLRSVKDHTLEGQPEQHTASAREAYSQSFLGARNTQRDSRPWSSTGVARIPAPKVAPLKGGKNQDKARAGEIDISDDISTYSNMSTGNETTLLSTRSEPGNSVVRTYNRAVRAQREGQYEEAIPLYEDCADRGYAKAQHNLAILYEKGLGGLPEDPALAVKYFRMAAKKNLPDSLFCLAMHYRHGAGVEQSDTRCLHFLERAARQGHAKAQYNLAVLIEEPLRDERKAERDSTQEGKDGIEGGSADFQGTKFSETAKGKWVSQRAEGFYKAAAEAGHAKAAVNLGALFARKESSEEAKAEAAKWFKVAAELDDPSGLWNLAISYDNGKGLQKDSHKAMQYLELAAEKNHVKSQSSLGQKLLHKAKHLQQDDETNSDEETADAAAELKQEALKWLKKAKDNGDSDAARMLRAEQRSSVSKRPTEQCIARVKAAVERRQQQQNQERKH